jgi:hypothetical protein
MKDKILYWLNQILVIDFFLVLIGFIWFAIAITGHFLNIPLGFDIWYQLWQPLFTPAIGILILGALGNAIVAKILKLSKKSSQQ